MIRMEVVDLSEHEWDILLALKRELGPEEIRPTPWALRAKEAGVTLDEFYRVAEDLSARKIAGRDFTMSLSLTGCGAHS